MGSDAADELDGQKRHKNRRAKQHEVATLQGIGKGAGLTPMKMGGYRQDERQ